MMENEPQNQQRQPQNPQPSFQLPVEPQPASPTPEATPPPAPLAQPPQEPTVTPSGETPKKTGGGMMKWLGIGAGVLVVGGIAAAGLYYGGFLTPKTTDELKGAAGQTSQTATVAPEESQTPDDTQVETQQSGATQETQELSGITQIALTACPQGQVKDPVTNLCTCDINNNYFQIKLQDAYSAPTASQAATSCTTCAALSEQILELGSSTDPADTSLKNELNALSEQHNCTPCAVFDDLIAKTQQSKLWDEYFEVVVAKSLDKTCGRTLSTCDSLKWQLLFLTDLRDKAGNDEKTGPGILTSLKEGQQSIANDLGTNSTCYDIKNLCSELKTAYGTKSEAVTLTQETGAPMVGTAPLMGTGGSSSKSAASQPTSQTQQAPGASTQQISLEDGTKVDLGSTDPAKLFSKDFYLMHCPVDGMGVSTSPPAPVKRVKRVQS